MRARTCTVMVIDHIGGHRQLPSFDLLVTDDRVAVILKRCLQHDGEWQSIGLEEDRTNSWDGILGETATVPALISLP